MYKAFGDVNVCYPTIWRIEPDSFPRTVFPFMGSSVECAFVQIGEGFVRSVVTTFCKGTVVWGLRVVKDTGGRGNPIYPEIYRFGNLFDYVVRVVGVRVDVKGIGVVFAEGSKGH